MCLVNKVNTNSILQMNHLILSFKKFLDDFNTFLKVLSHLCRRGKMSLAIIFWFKVCLLCFTIALCIN